MENSKKFKATVEWMKQKYDEFNESLFYGRLGKCSFIVERSGKTRRLGWFRLSGPGLKYNYYRRMFVLSSTGEKVYIDSDNFFEYAKPVIGLNLKYDGTEESWSATLVHEMCHYYTYMNGFLPKQGHGVEFRDIAFSIAIRSNNRFTVQRLATAEEMSGYELDSEAESGELKRMKGSTVLLIYKEDGEIDLVITKTQSVIDDIFNRATYTDSPANKITQIKATKSTEALQICIQNGYLRVFKTYRWWPRTKDDKIIKELESLDMETHSFKQQSLSLRETIQKAVKEAIDSEINKQRNERKKNLVHNITPDMDLGAYSPIEYNGL